MSNQSDKQASIRAATGTTGTYEGDWHALFDSLSIGSGTYNERLLAYINQQLSASLTNLPGAMQAFAEDRGFDNWDSMGTFNPGFDFSSLNGYAGNWDFSVASSLTLTGNNIDTVADLSGAGNDVSFILGTEATNQGSINGRVAADGVNETAQLYRNASVTLPSAGAFVTAIQAPAAVVAHGIAGLRSLDNSIFVLMDLRGANKLGMFAGDGVTAFTLNSTTAAYTSDAPFIAAMRWDATNIVGWINLTKQSFAHGQTWAGGSVTPLLLTIDNGSGINSFHGDYGQAIYYDQDNTDADIEAAIQGLADKWGISI